MDAVAREASREREVDARMASGLDKSVGRIKCRFCLAHTHLRLQHIDTWFSYGIYKRLLRGIRIKTKDVMEGKPALEVRASEPTLRQS